MTDALETDVWPKHLKQFQSLNEDLSIHGRMLIKGGCAIIPECLRQKTLEVAHEGHPSNAKFKSILRERVWWPGMAKDAEAWVKSCAVCATNGRPEKPTPMARIFAPQVVWETIGLDFNGPYVKFGGISILVVVDYRSRYVIAKPVRSTSFAHTRKVLDDIFEKEGFPKNMKSDNGPPLQRGRIQEILYRVWHQCHILHAVVPPAKWIGRKLYEAGEQGDERRSG